MELIFKTFIKNSDDTSDPEVRRRYGVLGGAAGIILNLILFCAKLFSGIVTSSIAVIADAFNNLSDAGSSIITLIGFKLSLKPADHDHPFGHGRIEYISALFVSVAILLMGLELAKSSVAKIITPEEMIFDSVSAVVLTFAILIKLWMYFFDKKIAVKISSESMHATAKDSLSDCITTAAVLISLIVQKLLKVNIDAYAGLLVSVFILITGFTTIRDSMSPLLGVAPDKELVNDIERTIMSHPEIVGIHDMVIHNYGPTRFMMSVHAEVPANSDFLKIHDTIDIIERQLSAQYGCIAVIHMDPIETDNKLVSSMHEKVNEIIKSIDPSLSMHDFRMVSGHTHTNLIFDVVVPFDFRMTDDELINKIQHEIFLLDKNYYAVITVDKNYV